MGNITMTAREAALVLGQTEMSLKMGIKQGVYPFGVAISSETGNRFRYIIYTERLKKWLAGEMG